VVERSPPIATQPVASALATEAQLPRQPARNEAPFSVFFNKYILKVLRHLLTQGQKV
jgi:hypothetical protein